MSEPNCIYKNKCKSKGLKCNQCENNMDKDDYFTPRRWHPIYPTTQPYKPHTSTP